MRKLLTVALLLPLSACTWVHMAPGASAVRVLAAGPAPANCENRGEVEVSVIFILLAGKAPTTTEFNDLVAELDALTTTPAAIAQAIIDSPEYATKISG